jgi:hypothetical protein
VHSKTFGLGLGKPLIGPRLAENLLRHEARYYLGLRFREIEEEVEDEQDREKESQQRDGQQEDEQRIAKKPKLNATSTDTSRTMFEIDNLGQEDGKWEVYYYQVEDYEKKRLEEAKNRENSLILLADDQSEALLHQKLEQSKTGQHTKEQQDDGQRSEGQQLEEQHDRAEDERRRYGWERQELEMLKLFGDDGSEAPLYQKLEHVDDQQQSEEQQEDERRVQEWVRQEQEMSKVFGDDDSDIIFN